MLALLDEDLETKEMFTVIITVLFCTWPSLTHLIIVLGVWYLIIG